LIYRTHSDRIFSIITVATRGLNIRKYHMTTRTTIFVLGACAGAALLIAKAARPLAAYALAGGVLAYETACDAVEASREFYRSSVKKRHYSAAHFDGDGETVPRL
jgi:hypothetical protein